MATNGRTSADVTFQATTMSHNSSLILKQRRSCGERLICTLCPLWLFCICFASLIVRTLVSIVTFACCWTCMTDADRSAGNARIAGLEKDLGINPKSFHYNIILSCFVRVMRACLQGCQFQFDLPSIPLTLSSPPLTVHKLHRLRDSSIHTGKSTRSRLVHPSHCPRLRNPYRLLRLRAHLLSDLRRAFPPRHLRGRYASWDRILHVSLVPSQRARVSNLIVPCHSTPGRRFWRTFRFGYSQAGSFWQSAFLEDDLWD